MDERTLLRQAKQVDAPALSQLLTAYLPMVKSLAKSGAAPALEEDDLVQEGLLGLQRAIQTYDDALGVPFSAYARTCVRNRMLQAIEAAGRKKHQPLNSFLPMEDSSTANQGNEGQNPEEILLAEEAAGELNKMLSCMLSRLEGQTLDLFLDGYSYAEIARQLNITEKSVDNALLRVRRKLKQVL